MRKPKTPAEASAEYDRKQKQRERERRRLERGLAQKDPQPSGAHERSYQAELERRGQLRMFS